MVTMAYLMTCVLAALLSSVVSALPVGRGPLFSQPFYGGFGLNPAVRARPAFDGPTFVPVRDEEQISVNDIDAADDAYSFEYNVQADDGSHSRQEARDSDGTVRGSYTIQLADGRFRTVDYIADKDGFRAKVNTNEPGTDNQSPADVEWTSSASGNPTSRPTQIPQPDNINSRPEIVVLPTNVVNERPSPDGSISPQPIVPVDPTRPIQVIQPVVPAKPEEPRSPHHPPIGFMPPQPFSRIHLAPPSPIGNAWGNAIPYHNSLFSSQWPIARTPVVVSPYSYKKK